MKKSIPAFFAFTLGCSALCAKPVAPVEARKVATMFYAQNSAKQPQTLTLVYTGATATGDALYYVFDVNTNDGFVIVTADDAAHPILGYSTEKHFVVPTGCANRTIGFWMKKRADEINTLKKEHVEATPDIRQEWTDNFPSRNLSRNQMGGISPAGITSVAPLVQTTWDQSPYYNALCPGTGNAQSVTGCVATTMAQLMRFWEYPSKGFDSTSYCDCTAGGYTNQWGTLSANFSATTFNWNAGSMPLHVSSPNLAVAKLMYECGVSINMDYAANSSAAEALAIDAGGGPSAEIALVQYFGYDASTIQGYQKTAGKFTDSAWVALIKTDLNAGRPVMYEGDDSLQGGHCWVCDGYDVNNKLHMNWGWGGSDDGYFTPDNLTTSGGFNPVLDQEVLVGIQPPRLVNAGIETVAWPCGTVCSPNFNPVVTLENYGTDTLTTCQIDYQVDSGAMRTYSWTGSLPLNQTADVTLPGIAVNPGPHTFITTTNLPNNTTDGDSTNNTASSMFLSGERGLALPMIEGFEGSVDLPLGWASNNPSGTGAGGVVVTTVARTGSNCIGFDNCDGPPSIIGQTSWIYTPTYDFSTASATANMHFDVAYAVYDQNNQLSTDTLVVLSSFDCGNTWAPLYKKGGMALSTAGTITGSNNCWTPDGPSNWRGEVIQLRNLAGNPSVMFAFENISDFGEWIYIDNVNITTSSLGLADNNNSDAVGLYPNPATGSFQVEGAAHTGPIKYQIFNTAGQLLESGVMVPAESSFKETIDIGDLPPGLYFVKMMDDTHTWTKKVSIR